MKKINLFWLAAFLMILPLGVTSCSDDEEDGPGSSADLIGIWELEYALYQEYEDGKLIDEEEVRELYRLVFKEDGTYMGAEYENGRWEYDDRARWSYKNGKLTVFYFDEYGGEPETYLVKELTATKLVLEWSDKYREDGVSYEDYEREVYRRIVD